MFTGIVRELGTVEALQEEGDGARLTIRAPETAAGTASGGSVSVNGVCLTAVASAGGTLEFDVVAETLRRSSLVRLRPGAAVNVEPALRAGEPLGGHLVQGHVDGVGKVLQADEESLEIAAAPEIMRYCVEKGSITVEGVSLTIAALGDDSFTVALIPRTREITTLGARKAGDEVNLEADVIAKHVERLLQPGYDPGET